MYVESSHISHVNANLQSVSYEILLIFSFRAIIFRCHVDWPARSNPTSFDPLSNFRSREIAYVLFYVLMFVCTEV